MVRVGVLLIVAFGAGLVVGAFLIRTDDGPEVSRPAFPPERKEPARLVKTTTPPPGEDDAAPLREEIRGLHLQVTELEAELKDARERLATSGGGDSPDEPEPAPADFEGEFAELVKGGLAAYAGGDFRKFIERMAEEDPEAYAFLYDLLRSADDATARFLAGAALEGIGDPAAIPALSEVLIDEEDLIVRRMASHAIAVIGTEKALQPLRKAMDSDTDWGVRVNAAYGIAKAGGEDGLEYLQGAYLSDDTPQEYLLAILSGLADVAAPSTAPLFRKILGDTEDPAYLFIAIAALKQMKDQRAVTELRRIVNSDLPESIRRAAADAMEALE